jgi:hypothetical protein
MILLVPAGSLRPGARPAAGTAPDCVPAAVFRTGAGA